MEAYTTQPYRFSWILTLFGGTNKNRKETYMRRLLIRSFLLSLTEIYGGNKELGLLLVKTINHIKNFS